MFVCVYYRCVCMIIVCILVVCELLCVYYCCLCVYSCRVCILVVVHVFVWSLVFTNARQSKATRSRRLRGGLFGVRLAKFCASGDVFAFAFLALGRWYGDVFGRVLCVSSVSADWVDVHVTFWLERGHLACILVHKRQWRLNFHRAVPVVACD